MVMKESAAEVAAAATRMTPRASTKNDFMEKPLLFQRIDRSSEPPFKPPLSNRPQRPGARDALATKANKVYVRKLVGL
jgi:hypothetical protein